MRKQIATLALSSLFGLGILAAAPPNQGDQNQNTTPPAKESARRQQADPQREVNRLGKKLNLTDDQKNQILPILTERQQTMRSIHQDSSLSAEDRRAKMRAAWEDSDNKIKAALNDQQKQKYDEMQQARRERMNHHREQGPRSAQPQS
ncbi:MAG: hypothetical protein JOY62_18885 [Acidobacteriaceae bacterium]|nr:hypothetical protein [Acidobacteriaceae bacterium]MBV9782034.1 hypothetical protein [Acidobacteriaceae bacterium]